MTWQYDLFLSYASKDREIVRAVNEALTSRGMRTFFDRRSLATGGVWIEDIALAIQASRAFAVIVASDRLGRVQRREVQLAFVQHAKRIEADQRFPLIPVLLDGATDDALSGFLELFTWIDVRGTDVRGKAIEELVQAVSPDYVDAPATSRPQICPYRGLRAFHEQDEPWFFGRENFALRLTDLLHSHRIVAVIGPSGSGKSSVVQAGLFPSLRRARPPHTTWETVTLTPGGRPFHRLAFELAKLWTPEERPDSELVVEAERVGSELDKDTPLSGFIDLAFSKLDAIDRLLIVVDQFEELFTLRPRSTADSPHADPSAVAQRFVAMLIAALQDRRVSIALTLRADFYGRAVALNRDLSDALAEGQVALGPMRPDELRAAIEGPARKVGLALAPGLVERILADAEGQPGNLALLEFALTEVWHKRGDNGPMTHEAYDLAGGLAGAIAQRAERVFTSLAKDAAAAAAKVLPRLVRIAGDAEEGSDSRQLLALEGLEPLQRTVLHEFATARLVVVGRNELTGVEYAEMAHEALIRDWPRLQQWIGEDRRFLLWHQRLDLLAAEWASALRDSDLLLRGTQLREARQWLRQRGASMDAGGVAFVRASTAAQTGSRALRWTAAAAIVFVVAAGAGWWAYRRSDAYQIEWVANNAPLQAALNSGRSWDDRYIEALEDWGRASAHIGRTDDLYREFVLSQDYGRDEVYCMLAAASQELRLLGLESMAERIMSRLVEQFSKRPAQEEGWMCIARASLSDEHAARVREVAELKLRETNAVVTKGYPLESRLWAAFALRRLGQRVDDWQVLLEHLITNRGQWTTPENSIWLSSIGPLVELGDVEAAELLSLSPFGRDDYASRMARSELIVALLKRGDINHAHDTSLRGSMSDEHVRTQARVAQALVRAGRKAEALSEVESLTLGGDEYLAPVYAESYARVAQALAETNATGEALRLLERAEVQVRMRDDDDRTSRALAEMAIAYARLGRLYTARLHADGCRNSHSKLRAYAAIALAARPAQARPERVVPQS